MNTKKMIVILLMSMLLFAAGPKIVKASASDNNKANATQESDTIKDKKTQTKVEKKIVGKTGKYTKAELRYMAAIIYCEAGNQSYAGKLAVGIVVKNRMESKSYPKTIKGVLYQPYQFTPARNGMLSKALKTYDKNGFKTKYYKDCLKAAKAALSGEKTVQVGGNTKSMKGYLFFSRYVSGCRMKIGAHMFK